VIAFLWRVFLIALVIWLLYRLVLTWLRNRAAGKAEAAPARESAQDGLHEMVQDHICQVYLPRNQALMLKHGGQEHFFCSVECKNKFLQTIKDKNKE
jgi:YHS domain-containing protein